MKKQLFSLGKIVATAGAIELLKQHGLNPADYLIRHNCGDFGDLCSEDRKANQEAIACGDRIFSSYKIDEANKLWIISEADRSSTTLLLPEEY